MNFLKNTQPKKPTVSASSKLFGYTFSGLVFLISILGLMTNNNKIRITSVMGVLLSFGWFSAICVVSEQNDSEFQTWLDKSEQENEELLKSHERELTTARNQNEQELAELKQAKEHLTQLLELEREGAKLTIDELNSKVKAFSLQCKQCTDEKTALSVQVQELTSTIDQTANLLEQNTISEETMFRNVVSSVLSALKIQMTDVLSTKFVDLRDFISKGSEKFRGSTVESSLLHLVDQIDTAIKQFQSEVNELPAYSEPYSEVLNLHVAQFNKIHEFLSSSKVRLRNTLNTNERLQLKNSVDRSHAIEQLEKMARSQDEFTLNYEAALDEIENLIGTIEQQRENIHRLETQLEQSKVRPVLFNPASRDDLRMGNLIINYFQKSGVWLDRGYSKYQGHKATLSFHLDRNDPPITVDALNKHSESLQDLLRCLNSPEFKRNAETGMVDVNLDIAPKSKETVTDESDISRIWKPASEFKKVVSQFSRIRLTGGSESGKSPTAENLAVTILENRPGDAVLYNPQFDSAKNHWSIPTVGKTHSDSARGVKELAAKVQNRSEGLESREEHLLYIFDEIDSTFGETSKPREVGESIKYTIKQASHQNLSVIYIGQNANVSNYPGMQRSDWNSAVNIHIGSNAYDAIANSNSFTAKQAEALRQQADRLMEYCQRKNEELGLDGSHPKAYRFALVIEPNKTPYYIELPEFGLYRYSEPLDSQKPSQKPLELSVTSSKVLGDESNVLTLVCPSCGSENVSKHGNYKGKTRYRCLNSRCSKKTFVP